MTGEEHEAEVRRLLAQAQEGVSQVRRALDDPESDSVDQLMEVGHAVTKALEHLGEIRLTTADRTLLFEVARMARDRGVTPLEYVSQRMDGAPMRSVFRKALEALV